MSEEEKHREYESMHGSHKSSITVSIPNGPTLICKDSWDFRSGFGEISLKTTMPILVEHPLLRVEEVDLFPVTSKKFNKLSILRQPPSNLINEPNRNKNIL
jgi:hypothetical protein